MIHLPVGMLSSYDEKALMHLILLKSNLIQPKIRLWYRRLTGIHFCFKWVLEIIQGGKVGDGGDSFQPLCYCFVNPLRMHLAHSDSSPDCHNTKVVTQGAILDFSICHGELDSFATLITLAELSGQGLPYSCLLAARV